MAGNAANAARMLGSSRATYGGRGRSLGGRSYGGGLVPSTDLSYLLGGPYPARAIANANEAEAMGLPPFGRGVELLCNAVAGTNWEAVRKDPASGVLVPWPTQPQVLTNPAPHLTPWHFRWGAVADLILYGNTWALCGTTDPRTRRPGWLVPVDASSVGVLWAPDGGSWGWVIDGIVRDAFIGDPGDPPEATWGDLPVPDYTDDGQSPQVLHISAGQRGGYLEGVGVLRQYGHWLGGAVAVEDHAGSYFAGGALPPAVLQAPQALTQAQADDLKTKWRTMVSTREPVVLPSGYTLVPVLSNADEAQLVESRTWSATETAMILGIPSYKLGLPGSSMTYQNIDSADIEFVRDSVDRYAAPLASAFSQLLMPNGTQVQWDYAQRMRADQATVAEVLAVYVNAKILTVDEARARINEPPLPEPPPAVGPPLPPDPSAEQGPDDDPTTDDATDDDTPEEGQAA